MFKKAPQNFRHHRARATVPSRQPHKRVLAIYTGEVTEKDILQALKNALPHGVLGIQYKKNIKDSIQFATNAIAAAHDDPYDAIFIVSDVDNLQPETLRIERTDAAALSTSTTKVAILLSNPCIEVWLACYTGSPHRAKISTIKNAQSYVAEKGFTFGRDNKKVHTELLQNHRNAIREAKRLNACHGSALDFTTDFPSTEFHELLEFVKDEL